MFHSLGTLLTLVVATRSADESAKSDLCHCISCITTQQVMQRNEQRQRGDILENNNEDTRELMFIHRQIQRRLPTDDPQKRMTLFLLAQQNLIPKKRIPADSYRIISDYSDYIHRNEIRSLFRILPREDRQGVLGFDDYHQMHQRYPLRISKVEYLKTLQREHPGVDDESSAESSAGPGGKQLVTFDDSNTFIQTLCLDTYVDHVTDQSDPRKDPTAIRWNAVGELKHLKYLSLQYLNITITMNDIRLLPDSLLGLEMDGNIWTEPSGDIDLSLLPVAMEELSADSCKGCTGVLKLAAPQSHLVELSLISTEITDIIDFTTLPPSLKRLYTTGRRLHVSPATVAFLRAKDIEWKIYC